MKFPPHTPLLFLRRENKRNVSVPESFIPEKQGEGLSSELHLHKMTRSGWLTWSFQ